MKTIIILLALSMLFSISACKKKKTVVETPPQIDVVETTKTEAVLEVKEDPAPPVKQMNYYLVAGCFRVKSNADHLNAKLVNEGYASKIIPYYNFHMVTYNGYESRPEAQIALNRLVFEPGKEDAWVYPVK